MIRETIPVPIEYPTSDGNPMAETKRHFIATVDVWQRLERYYRNRSDVFVGADQLLYYVEGDPRKSVAPDIYVVLGAPKLPPRDTWQVWREDGRTPDFILEVTSKKTRRMDEGRKRRLYQKLGVVEYWQYDPTGDYLNPVLKGQRLRGGRYRPIAGTAERDGSLRFQSDLGFELHLAAEELRIFDPGIGSYLPTWDEETARADAAEAAAAEGRRRIAELEAALQAASS